ncbi:MAG: hypothetical protein LUD01_08635, partial [Clostridiales bacterium]|nr:hypothetical protein [Clostridiales bacterium]
EQHGIQLIEITPKGTCPECGVVHKPGYPHYRDSIVYQYIFYDRHGRWPTWADAMAHCTDSMKAVWIKELEKRGIAVNG